KAFEYYNKAVRLDGTKADYWIGRAYSRAALPRVDLAEAKIDVDKALVLAPDSAAAHGALGYFCLLQSRQEADRAKRTAELREATEAYAKAVALAKSNEDDKAALLLNLSNAALELGNYTGDPKSRRKYIYEARDYAEQASKFPSAYPEYIQ